MEKDAADSPEIGGVGEVATLLGDPARARILVALLDGRALTATELAIDAGIAPSTASAHLAKLVDGELLAVELQGRHRYYRLAGVAAAELVEGLAGFAAARTRPARRAGPADPALRRARVCYDHLAGALGVRLFESLRESGALSGVDGCEVTSEGERRFAALGVDLAAARSARRAFARPCLDWSERRPHLGGALGAALLVRFLELGWLARELSGRALAVPARGEAAIRAWLDGGGEARIRRG